MRFGEMNLMSLLIKAYIMIANKLNKMKKKL